MTWVTQELIGRGVVGDLLPRPRRVRTPLRLRLVAVLAGTGDRQAEYTRL